MTGHPAVESSGKPDWRQIDVGLRYRARRQQSQYFCEGLPGAVVVARLAVAIAPPADVADDPHYLFGEGSVELFSGKARDGFEIRKRRPIGDAVVARLVGLDGPRIARGIEQSLVRQRVKKCPEIGPLQEQLEAPALVILAVFHQLDESLLLR